MQGSCPHLGQETWVDSLLCHLEHGKMGSRLFLFGVLVLTFAKIRDSARTKGPL